jgi:hypothetical protein
MDSRLSKLIADYQAKVAAAVAILESAGIPRPSTNREWVKTMIPHEGSLGNGFSYCKHGFGCRVRGPEWQVDFDFGDDGQIDGFDAGRLYDFAGARLPDYGFRSLDEVEVAVRRA